MRTRDARPPVARARLAALVAAALLPAGVAAQPVEADREKGEALFRDAKARVDAGDFDGGCPLFAQSLEVLPSASTAIHVARCHEHYERFASAIATYDRALELNAKTDDGRRAALEDIATKGRGSAVEKAPKILLVLDDALRDAPRLEITRDGALVPADEVGRPSAPLDVRSYDVAVRAEGFVARHFEVETRASEVATVRISLAPVARPTPPPEDPRAKPAPTPPGPEGVTRRRGVPIWSWVSGGVGIAFVGVGVGLLIDSRLAASRLDACESYGEADLYACPTDPYEDLASIERDIGRADFGLGFGVALLTLGAAGVAVGAAGIASVPSSDPPVAVVPVVTTSFVGVVVQGAM